MPDEKPIRLEGTVMGGQFAGDVVVYEASTFASFSPDAAKVWEVVNGELDEAMIRTKGGFSFLIRRAGAPPPPPAPGSSGSAS